MSQRIVPDFVCARCGNTVPFYHGIRTFSIDGDTGGYCSEICVRAVIESRGQTPFNNNDMYLGSN